VIVLDTNVVSEPLRPAGEPAVLAWLDQQNVETLFLSTISLAEMRYGVAALPDGRRKDGLSKALESRIVALFGTRVLHFDDAAAHAYALIRARAKAAARPLARRTAISPPRRRRTVSRSRRAILDLSRRPACPSSIRGRRDRPNEKKQAYSAAGRCAEPAMICAGPARQADPSA